MSNPAYLPHSVQVSSRGLTSCKSPLQVPRRHGSRSPVCPFDHGDADISLLGGSRSGSQDHVAMSEAESTELDKDGA